MLSLCTGAKISAKMPLCQAVYKLQIRTNPQYLMLDITTFNLLFFKAIPCKSVQYWVPMSKLHASFWESSLHVFLFWLWQSHFRTVGKISTLLEPKENYTIGTASTLFPGPLYCFDCINTQWFDGTRVALGRRSSVDLIPVINMNWVFLHMEKKQSNWIYIFLYSLSPGSLTR